MRRTSFAFFASFAFACAPVASTSDLQTPIVTLYGSEHCPVDDLRACMTSEGDCIGVDVECRTTTSQCVEFELYAIAECLNALGCTHLAALEGCVAGCEEQAQGCFAGAGDFEAIGGCYNARASCARACPYAGHACPES